MTINPYRLDERPGMDGWYIIVGDFSGLEMPKITTSYRKLEARLVGLTYEEYVIFCKESLGARIKRGKNEGYASIYFPNTEVVQIFVKLLNRKFRESYE